MQGMRNNALNRIVSFYQSLGSSLVTGKVAQKALALFIHLIVSVSCFCQTQVQQQIADIIEDETIEEYQIVSKSAGFITEEEYLFIKSLRVKYLEFLNDFNKDSDQILNKIPDSFMVWFYQDVLSDYSSFGSERQEILSQESGISRKRWISLIQDVEKFLNISFKESGNIQRQTWEVQDGEDTLVFHFYFDDKGYLLEYNIDLKDI